MGISRFVLATWPSIGEWPPEGAPWRERWDRWKVLSLVHFGSGVGRLVIQYLVMLCCTTAKLSSWSTCRSQIYCCPSADGDAIRLDDIRCCCCCYFTQVLLVAHTHTHKIDRHNSFIDYTECKMKIIAIMIFVNESNTQLLQYSSHCCCCSRWLLSMMSVMSKLLRCLVEFNQRWHQMRPGESWAELNLEQFRR